VYRWAGRMLVDAARLRRRERLTGRLTAVAEAAGTPGVTPASASAANGRPCIPTTSRSKIRPSEESP
jgi:hypothetical protein